MQVGALRPQVIKTVSICPECANHRNSPVQEGQGKVQADAFTDSRDEDGLHAHGFRNSARVWMFSLKQPPRAVVLVWELVSITPRDLTQ